MSRRSRFPSVVELAAYRQNFLVQQKSGYPADWHIVGEDPFWAQKSQSSPGKRVGFVAEPYSIAQYYSGIHTYHRSPQEETKEPGTSGRSGLAILQQVKR